MLLGFCKSNQLELEINVWRDSENLLGVSVFQQVGNFQTRVLGGSQKSFFIACSLPSRYVRLLFWTMWDFFIYLMMGLCHPTGRYFHKTMETAFIFQFLVCFCFSVGPCDAIFMLTASLLPTSPLSGEQWYYGAVAIVLQTQLTVEGNYCGTTIQICTVGMGSKEFGTIRHFYKGTLPYFLSSSLFVLNATARNVTP